MNEYLYRKLFGGTHEQFMDTPVEEIEWLLRIHAVYQKAENKANQQQEA